MIGWWRQWRRARVLARSAMPDQLWRDAVDGLPLIARLTDEQWLRLRELTTLFLHEKEFKPASGIQLDERMRVVIAIQACLPVLELGIDWLRGWRSIIVYPDEFVARHEEEDEDGVVHIRREARSGEAWDQAGVVLSWQDVAESGVGDGYNVVIHEIAHKLDMLNGDTDGFPPLHGEMVRTAWTAAFESAFEDLRRRDDAGEEMEIDPYAAESPGECFAVLSEYFFELPGLLSESYPDVYEQLAIFYRQDPLRRMVTS